MNKSESIGALAAALAKAQNVMEGAKKDSANPFFKSKYADLASVWDAVRGPLTDNGLSVVQTFDESDKGVIVETILCHTSGEFISGRLFVPVAKIDAQTIGSAATYARRYSLQSICGVAPEDDDGNAAVSNPQPAPKKAESKKESTKTSPDQDKYFPRIREALNTLFGDDRQKKMETVKHFTTFDGDDGKEVAGVEDYRKLDGKRLQVLAHKLEAIAKKQEGENA